jgi:tetratricopeptide (TPR) repeat protein
VKKVNLPYTPIVLFLILNGTLAAFSYFSELSVYFIFILNPLTILLFDFFYTRTLVAKTTVRFTYLILLFFPIGGVVLLSSVFLTYLIVLGIMNREKKEDVNSIAIFHSDKFWEYIENKEIHVFEKDNQIEKMQEALSIEPYLDVLESDHKELKLDAIDKLSKIGTPESIQLIKKGLLSDDYEVRFFAANALTKIEENELEKINRASFMVEENPSEPDLYNNRGFIYLNLYRLNIFDEMIAREFLEKSLYDFLFSMQLKDGQFELYEKVVNIYTTLKKSKEVVEMSSVALEQVIPDELKRKILFYQAEAYYNLKQYSKVREIIQEIGKSNIEYDLIKDVSTFWEEVYARN